MMRSTSPPPSYEMAAAEHGDAPETAPLISSQAQPASAHVRPNGARRAAPSFDLPIISYLNSKRVILASASPRRRTLLAQVGVHSLEIIPSTKPENLDKKTYGPEDYVAATARQKALDVYESQLKLAAEGKCAEPDVVIAADTVIATRTGSILEKPRSEENHVRMLRHLRDTVTHKVLTAVCVLAPRADARSPGYVLKAGIEETTVAFAQDADIDAKDREEGGDEDEVMALGDDVITAYVKTREGADKAGGYAIQGIGGLILIEKIDGSVDNVMGLPVRKTLALAERAVFQQDLDEEEEG